MNLIDFLHKTETYETVVAGVNHLQPGYDRYVLDQLSKWTIKKNSRAVGRLGQCSSRDRVIELSIAIFHPDEHTNLIDTLLHEVAHAVDHMLFNGRGHGRSWSKVMRAFGQRPERAGHSAQLKELRAQKSNYVYACVNCGHEWQAIKRWRTDKVHTKCGGRVILKYDGIKNRTYTAENTPSNYTNIYVYDCLGCSSTLKSAKKINIAKKVHRCGNGIQGKLVLKNTLVEKKHNPF